MIETISNNIIKLLVIFLLITILIIIYDYNCNCNNKPSNKQDKVVEHAFLSTHNRNLSNCDKTKISLQKYYLINDDNINNNQYLPTLSHPTLYKFPRKQRNSNNILDIMYNDKYPDDTPIYTVVEDIVPKNRCISPYIGSVWGNY